MGKRKNGGCADAIAFISANYKVWYNMADEMYEKVCYLISNARDNDGESQYWIAKTNLENIGITGNPNDAFIAAQKSVNAGYPKGYFVLGKCYKNGKGCLKDKEKAKECFNKGMMLGDAECTNALKSMERNSKLLAGGAFVGKALLNFGLAFAQSGALDPEGFDQIDDDYE